MKNQIKAVLVAALLTIAPFTLMAQYGGAMLGYNIVGVDYKGPGNATSDLSAITYTAFVGARYHFTSNIGAYGEVGYGVSLLTLGLTYRL
jgi:hypothetical protein